jgi:hypothetical protein
MVFVGNVRDFRTPRILIAASQPLPLFLNDAIFRQAFRHFSGKLNV